MKFPICLFFAVAVFIFTASLCSADQQGQQTLSADLKRLDALTRVFFETQARDDQFGESFWRASQRLANERGPAIINAVMTLSRKWKEEEGLVYVPLVALLPRDEALGVLHRYQHSKRESERVWAGEFIIEFGMSDTKAAVAKYLATHKSPKP